MEVNEMSVKQQEFLKGRQKHRTIVSVFRVLILLLFLSSGRFPLQPD